MRKIKSIGLIAHDACKNDMVEWVSYNAARLSPHRMFCTGTTGRLIKDVFDNLYPDLDVGITRFKSGPLGGDQQMGALIADGLLDILFFFTDPMTLQPHDVDVKALQRICGIANIAIATNRATADFVISSELFEGEYEAKKNDYGGYVGRTLG